jgi:hypothetical protein
MSLSGDRAENGGHGIKQRTWGLEDPALGQPCRKRFEELAFLNWNGRFPTASSTLLNVAMVFVK